MIEAMIIGCGRFSGFKDPENLNYYYGALKRSRIKLVSIYDKDFNKSKRISKKFNLNTSDNLKKLYKKFKPGIVIISSSIESHYQNIQEILEFKNFIKLLIIEKPIIHEFSKLKKTINSLIDNNIKFIVNHTRRFDKNYLYIKKNFSKYEIPKEIYFNYYGQWVNNGIHMIDLIFFFSQDKEFKKFYLYKKNRVTLLKIYLQKNKSITIIFNKGDQFKYQIADIDIFFREKRVQILNHGETYIYYLTKKNLIGEIELKINQKLKKINNFPLVNMLTFFSKRSLIKKKLSFLNKNKLINIYSLFFKLDKYLKNI